MRKWSQTTLGKIIASGGGKIQTGPFGSQLHASDYVRDGIPCVMPANMKGNRVDLSEIAFILPKDANRLSQHITQYGDILYSRRGDVTQKALITKKEVGYFCGTGCLLLRPGTEIDPEFLTYYLSAPVIKSWIEQQAVGATMSNLNTSILSRVPFCAPKKIMQQEISAVLSALDTKIDCNNRINAELEAMAKTLYDYWFVQFDFPDERGRPYKSSGGKMVYNEVLKREIPAGWSSKKLSTIANITMGQSPAGATLNDNEDGLPFFQGSTDFGWRFPALRQYTTNPTRFAKSGDILLSVRAPVGDINIADRDCCIGRGLAALRSKEGLDAFLLYAMDHFKQIFARRNKEGTTFGAMTKTDLHSLLLAYPSKSLLPKYDHIVSAYDQIIYAKSMENIQLTELRDWLLPMLMNGQVTVTDAVSKTLVFPVVAPSDNNYNQRFAVWRDNQALAARGSLDETTLREIFDAMDDDDK